MAAQANIKEERQALAELNDLVVHRALTPLQHAVFVVESFPSRPDGFAMATAVAAMPGAMRPVRRQTRPVLYRVRSHLEWFRSLHGEEQSPLLFASTFETCACA